MGNAAKSRTRTKAARWTLYALCLVWALLFVEIPDFTIIGPSKSRSPAEQDYLLDLRKKYSGTQRTLTPDGARKVIDEACAFIADAKNAPGAYDSADAKELLFGTACVESGLRPRFQDGGGDAIGLFQVEYATYRDIWDRIIKTKHPDLHSAMRRSFSRRRDGEITFEQLQQNDVVCAIFARMKYADSKERIPPREDETAQARYYKKYYNTHLGKATPKDFIARKRKVLGEDS